MTKSDSSRQRDCLTLKDSVWPFGDNKIGWLLSHAIRGMHAIDDKGRRAYQQTVAILRERPEELLHALKHFECHRPEGSFVLEWAIHYILADLEVPALIPTLVATAIRKISEHPCDSLACERVEDNQVLVQIMAVEAIERLVHREKQHAIQALLEIIKAQPHLAVRRPAVQAVLKADPAQFERLREILPESQRFVLALKRVPVEDLNAPVHPGEFRPRPDRPGAAPRLKEERTSPPTCTCLAKER